MDYNITYAIECVGGRLHKRYRKLSKLVKPEFRPTVTNIFRSLTSRQPWAVRQILAERKAEITPGLLAPFSPHKKIYSKAGDLSDSWRKIIKEVGRDNLTHKMWEDFCSINNLGSFKMPSRNKLTYPGYWYSVLCRLLRKASFVYSMIAEGAKNIVPDSFLKYTLSLCKKRRYKTNIGAWSYSQLKKIRQYTHYCNYLARSNGVAGLAQWRGLGAHLITITPLPEYHCRGEYWQGKTPEQVSRLLTAAYRVFTDSMRHAGVDLDAIRVIEPHDSGTPHLHLLIFTDDFNRVMPALRKAYVDKVEVCGTMGVRYIKRVHDDEVESVIRYLLKTFKGDNDAVMAWSEQGAHRRFGITSTAHKYPSREFWEQGRKGLASIQQHETYSKILRADVSGNKARLDSINSRLNIAAKCGDYAEFCMAFWDATADDEQLGRDLMKSVVSSTFPGSSQLCLNYQDNYLYCQDSVDYESGTNTNTADFSGAPVEVLLPDSS